MYESAAVFPSAYKYDKNNLDMKIHDTHGESAPVNEHKSFPNDFFDIPIPKIFSLQTHQLTLLNSIECIA